MVPFLPVVRSAVDGCYGLVEPPGVWSASNIIRDWRLLEAHPLGPLDLRDLPVMNHDLDSPEAQRAHRLTHRFEPGAGRSSLDRGRLAAGVRGSGPVHGLGILDQKPRPRVPVRNASADAVARRAHRPSHKVVDRSRIGQIATQLIVYVTAILGMSRADVAPSAARCLPQTVGGLGPTTIPERASVLPAVRHRANCENSLLFAANVVCARPFVHPVNQARIASRTDGHRGGRTAQHVSVGF